jgi:hypothetical protein
VPETSPTWRAGDRHHAILQRLTQDLEDVATELRQLIQKEHAMVRQRHVAGHWHLSPANQPDIGPNPNQAFRYAMRARKRNRQGLV